jgi:hypothetical protein
MATAQVVNGEFDFDESEWSLGDFGDLIDEKKLRKFLNESFSALIDSKSNDGFMFWLDHNSFTGDDFVVELHFGSGEGDPSVRVKMSELLAVYLDDDYDDSMEMYELMARSFRTIADRIEDAGRKSVENYEKLKAGR